MPAAGTAPAVAWAHAAARRRRGPVRVRRGRRPPGPAARRDRRRRRSQLPDADLVGLLTAEADLRLRAGDAAQARTLLDTAWARATATGEADLLGAVALGLDRIDARFAMPRADLIAVLDTARQALQGSGTPAEAQVTAALARQLQHSVPADRPRARPLAERAVAIARTLDDPATLASCLLAQHDTLWTPGTATDRAAIAAEIADLAKRANDPERHAQALLLTATEQLENGSAAFRATLAEYAYLTQRLRQPRHDYLLRTRQAALALLDGDIETGERLSAEAAALGEAVGDSDTGNVRMSQRLEIVRARNDPAELRDMAAEAVQWWIGAPAHAHAVAAGFSARAGDLDTARRELDTVLALPDWRTDRSYLWSVFVGEMATAAIALRRPAAVPAAPRRPACRSPTPAPSTVPSSASWAPTPTGSGSSTPRSASRHRPGSGSSTPWTPTAGSAPEPGRPRPTARWPASTASDAGSRHTARRTTAAQSPPTATCRGCAASATCGRPATGGTPPTCATAKGLHDLAALLAHPGTDLPALQLAGAETSESAGPGADRTRPRPHRAGGLPAAPGRTRRRTRRRADRRPTSPASNAPPTNANSC